MSDGTLAAKAARGVAWNYLSFGLGKGLVLITTAVLARLLTPEQFGVVGFATIAVSYLSV
ncbi:MAG: oligosaccharide flippase family protein, partial [Anaerolineales bacterium]|nr:oligosaccharide flippase family protein [Anaerolineales bacterium]